MTGRRQELAESFRLLAGEERWVATDSVLGVAATVAWMAGTGALAARGADAFGYATPVGPGGTWTPTTVGVVLAVWVLVPAFAGAWQLRARVLNLHGNVEQYYRLETPAALLAPPALLLGVLAVWTLALWPVREYLLLAAVPAGWYLLARTLAYCYRVYAVSRPLVLHVANAAALAVQVAGVLVFAADRTGRAALATGALTAAGLPARLADPLWPGAGATPTLLWLGALAPAAVALSYLSVQSLGALAVRALEPEVDRSSMRTGQRYPPFLEVTAPGGAAGGSPGSDAGESGADGDRTDPPVAAGADGAAASAAAGDGSAERAAESGEAGESDGADRADGDSEDGDGDGDEEDDLDDVSHTRVFTPPDDADDGGF